jgi:DNA-binding NtrC family response regulator
MTLIAALLAKAWPGIVIGVGALASWLYVFVNKKKADTQVAQEQQKTAAAQADASEAKASAAATNEVAAKADKAAAETALKSSQESQNVDKEYAAMPDGAAMQRLRDEGFVANDDGTAATGPAPAAGSGGADQSH